MGISGKYYSRKVQVRGSDLTCFIARCRRTDNPGTVYSVTRNDDNLTIEPGVNSPDTLDRQGSWSPSGDSLKSRSEQMIREYELETVKSNVVPNLSVLGSKNTKTQDENGGTSQEVKRRKVSPVGEGSSRPFFSMSNLAECRLISTRSRVSTNEEDGNKRKYLVWNCQELSVNSARKIITRYSDMKPGDYSLKKVIQPNGGKRFDIILEPCVEGITDQKWKRVSKALNARIKGHKKSRRLSDVNPTPEMRRVMDEFSTMTYNINGLWGKRQEAYHLLDRCTPTVFAFQETLRKSLARTFIPRYQTIENQSKPGGGARGVILGVRRDSGFTLCEYEVKDWFVSGQVDGTLQDGSCIRMLVYSVYVPCTVSSGRSEAKEKLKSSLLKAWRKGNFTQILVMGDFNMNPSELDNFFESTQIGIRRAILSEPTRIGSRGGRSILDYIGFLGMETPPLRMKVYNEIDLSDHLPIMAKWKLPSTPKVQSKLSLNTVELIAKRGFFLDNERWITSSGSLNIDELAESFTNVPWEIARQNGVVREYKEPKWSSWMSKKTLAIIEARHEMAALRGTTLFNQQIYEQLWVDSIASRKDDAKRVSLKRIKDMCEAGRENRFKDLWKQLDNACGGMSRKEDLPVMDKSTGELKFTVLDKGKVWAKHFEVLAKDETGNSRCDEYWKSILPTVDTVPIRDLCDDPLTWTEARQAIKAIPNGKAAGIDLIPGELLKLTQEEETPSSQLGKALWNILEKIWVNTTVPASYRPAIVVPVPKKGDLTDPDNYRGISLISVVLKVISKVVATRLHSIAERDNLLVKEQAGFRTREECVAQVAALTEIVKRRSNINQATYAIFIDFAKAYDKVPHKGMLRKLQSIGIKGHLYKVIEALYEDPEMCVRISNDLSEKVKYRCGVRQGCPASPILFDLYINDIFHDINGIVVPGISNRVPGLLFADDAVAFADSEEELANVTEKLNDWALKWEMKINVRKCGILIFPPRLASNLVQTNSPTIVKIGEELVPVVDKYTYLGITIDKDISRESMVRNNVEKGRKTLGNLTKFFSRKTYPTYLKVLLLKAKLIPILTYGGEIWGMNTQVANQAQKVCDIACRTIVRGGRSTGLRRVREELGIDTIASIAARKRLRALTKFESLRTWIATLITDKVKSRYDTWVTGGTRWMRTYVSNIEGGEGLQDSKRRLLDLFSDRERRQDHTRASARAIDLGFSQSSPWLEIEGLNPELCEMLTEVGRMRIGIFPTGKRLVYQRMLSSDFTNNCPICKCNTPESLEHLFLECQTWNSLRETKLKPYFSNWESMIQSPAAKTLVVGVLLGGEQGNRENTFAGVFGPQDQTPVISAMPVATKEPREMVVITARFLAGIIPIRRRILSQKLSRNLRTSSWNQGHRGTVALAEP